MITEIEELKLSELKPYANNPRTHSDKQINQIAASIKEFGFTIPLLIDEKNMIIAGHGRLLAAKEVDLEHVPCIRADHLTDAQKRAYIIADNKLTENGGWDMDILSQEFSFLNDADLNFSLEITGFEIPEIDMLLGHAPTAEPDDPIPDIDRSKGAVTKEGDLWRLGPHYLYCGNALIKESYMALMQEDKATAIFTDPPYNVPITGHVCGNGSVQHEEFAMAAGEMSPGEFTEFLSTAASLMIDFSCDGSIHYICMDWRHLKELLAAGDTAGYDLKNMCVWAKDNGGMGSFYRSRHEIVMVYKNGKAPHINNIQLGKYGRNRTNVWEYAGVNSFKGQMSDLALHPTVKPTAMVADAILDCSNINDIVLDPFGGSGTTLIAAEKTQRQARLIELDPHYCDVIIQRWQEMTKSEAILVSNNASISEKEANDE